MNEVLDSKSEKMLKELTCLAIDSGFTMKNTKVNILGKEYHAMFSYKEIPNKCPECGEITIKAYNDEDEEGKFCEVCGYNKGKKSK